MYNPLIMVISQDVLIVTRVSSVGLTEKQAIDQGYEIKVGKFPFSASGKASASGNKEDS